MDTYGMFSRSTYLHIPSTITQRTRNIYQRFQGLKQSAGRATGLIMSQRSMSFKPLSSPIKSHALSNYQVDELLKKTMSTLEPQLAIRQPQPSLLRKLVNKILNIETEEEMLKRLNQEFMGKLNTINEKESKALSALEGNTPKIKEEMEKWKRGAIEGPNEDIFIKNITEFQNNIDANIDAYVRDFDNVINSFITTPNASINIAGVKLFHTQDLILPYILSAMERIEGITAPVYINAKPSFAHFYPLLKKEKLLNKNVGESATFEIFAKHRFITLEKDIYKDLKSGAVKSIPERREFSNVKSISGKDRLKLYILLEAMQDLGTMKVMPENQKIIDYITQLKKFAQSKNQQDLRFMLEDGFTIDQLPSELQPELQEAWQPNE
jgi:hypothetical protein